MIKLKIKTRLLLYVCSSSFLIIVLFSSAIYSEMKEIIEDMLKSRISNISELLKKELIIGNSDDINNFLSSKEHRKVYIKAVGGDKSYLSKVASLSSPLKSSESKFTERLQTKDKKNLKDVLYRFQKQTFFIKGQNYDVVIGISVKDIEEELEELLFTLFFGTIASFIAIIVFGVFIANSILKPVQNIINSANTINSQNLGLRIESPKTKDEIHELTATLNNLFERLYNSFKMQNEFIGNISHEIKTPLSVLNVLVDKALQSDSCDSDSYDIFIQFEATLNRINKLVKDLINLNYLETSRISNFESVDINSIIEDILENVSEMIKAKEIEVTLNVENNIFVKGDERLLHSTFLNLIHNAIKYNISSGKIDIKSHSDKQFVKFSISNSYSPFEDEDLDKFFDRFYRAEKSRSREYGGAGLGLSIVKEIIHNHGGEIAVSKPECSTISFSFKLISYSDK